MERMIQNISEAKKALAEKPLLATSAERFLILNELKSQYKDLPQPKRFSKILTLLLERVSVPLEEYDLIAGRCVDRELTFDEEQLFQAYIKHPDYPKKEIFLSSGHCTYSWEAVVVYGLPGLKERAVKSLEKQTDREKRIFLSAILDIYDAIQSYMLRYAKAAQKRGMDRLANTLIRAATETPSDFAAALQLLWIITLIDCAYITQNPTLTVGRLDKILYPLYVADLQNGTLTREEAKDLITDYYCKHNLIMGRGEHQVGDATNSTTFERICNFDAPQYLLLAGTDENGESAVNELTALFAECICPAFKNPVVVTRYFPGMNEKHPALWKTLTQKALQSASLMFYNDHNLLQAYRSLGIPMEDCRNYAHFGCNWASLGDCSAWMQGGPSSAKYHAYHSAEEEKELRIPYMRTNSPHSWPEDFMIVMRELAEKDPATVTIEDFYQGFFARMESFMERKLKHCAHELEVRRRRPAAVLTFGDCFFTESVQNAACFSAGAKYHFELQSFQMFATVADCFTVVDKLVFHERKFSIKEFLNAVDANFEGYPQILALCRNTEKYGSDNPLSNAHVKRLSEIASRMTIEKSRPYLETTGLFLEPCMQSDTWHLRYGEAFGATPDGRLANTPFSQNTRPANGSCINGLTAMFNAMLQIPTNALVSGALNLDLDPKQFEGEDGQKRFAALLATYFNRGGLHAQVTCANVNDLIDAQIHPEQHRDLRVRVTGYSGVFVDICQRLQNDIIERLK